MKIKSKFREIISEDFIFNKTAQERDTKSAKFIVHKKAWKYEFRKNS